MVEEEREKSKKRFPLRKPAMKEVKSLKRS